MLDLNAGAASATEAEDVQFARVPHPKLVLLYLRQDHPAGLVRIRDDSPKLEA